MTTMGENKAGINNRLYEKANAEVDYVHFLSVDHICNIALAEWLQRKVKADDAEKRRKEKSEREHKATLLRFYKENEENNEENEKERQAALASDKEFYVTGKGEIKPV